MFSRYLFLLERMRSVKKIWCLIPMKAGVKCECTISFCIHDNIPTADLVWCVFNSEFKYIFQIKFSLIFLFILLSVAVLTTSSRSLLFATILLSRFFGLIKGCRSNYNFSTKFQRSSQKR